MAANVDAILREGIDALKAGKKDDARTLFLKVVEVDQFNEQGWLWLSAVVETAEDQQTCLENVLSINPANERARQGLQYIAQQRANRGGGAAVSWPAPSSTTPPPSKAAHPPEPPPPPSDTLSTSVEWAAPSDSTPVTSKRPGLDLSEDDLDNWVSTLNLPSTPAAAAPLTASSPFVTDDENEIEFFKAPSPALPATPPPVSPPPSIRRAPPPRDDEDERFTLGSDAHAAALEIDDEPEEVVEHEALFPDIPDEIRATRLPGTHQRMPIWLLLALAVVIALNIMAAIFLVQRLTV